MALINRDMLAQVLANVEPLKLAVDRGTGKTTAAVLSALAEAMQDPGEWVNVLDNDGASSHELVAETVGRVVQALQLQRVSHRTVEGRPYVQVRSDFAEVLE